MAQPISAVVYLPNFNFWARPVTFKPRVGGSFEGRGIWHKNMLEVMTQDGTVFSDHKMTLSIRDDEFAIQPLMGDRLDIPADAAHPALGEFEVTDVDYDGEGGTELTLRKIEMAAP